MSHLDAVPTWMRRRTYTQRQKLDAVFAALVAMNQLDSASKEGRELVSHNGPTVHNVLLEVYEELKEPR